jgi:hypothetical protein
MWNGTRRMAESLAEGIQAPIRRQR